VIALLAIFILVPIAELYVIFKIGDAIGWPLALGLLAADSILGTLLMRSQGRAVWRRFTEAVETGRVPHREVLDGVMIIFGGAFLITPGFLTDIIGVTLLLPPTRTLWRRLIVNRGGRRFTMFVAGGGRPGRRSAPPDWDVEGTAVEREPPRLER
jgi:UPF0716 protein FxsA